MNNTENIDIPSSLFDQNLLKAEFDKYIEIRYAIVNELKERTENILTAIKSAPVVNGRIKNFSSYFTKYIRLLKIGQKDPLITDLMGLRIVCPFIEDLQVIQEVISKNFKIIEKEIKGHYTFKEFGYESTHLLIKIPNDMIDKYGYPGTEIAEIQVRTILQDAWAEVEHELVYKAEFSPFDDPMKRKLAAVNASLSLADIIFQEIRSYQRKYTNEMDKRRESFFQKIEESIDNLLFTEQIIQPPPAVKSEDYPPMWAGENHSIDDLLVHALSAHNQNRFDEAIMQYTKILELKPQIDPEMNYNNNAIRSIIFKHRGMAHFANSQYDLAIEDFSASLKLDNEAYKVAYYRGVVNSVLKQFSQAIDDYSLSLSINPYQSFCLFRRAQAYFHIGDFPGALADCENSLSLEPGNQSAVKFKNILLEKLKM
ncbi:MAG: tetratricopeptide repeat protein [Treponema sp.]|nr:tetratricopeptide repeat protein [Treponema sp.]